MISAQRECNVPYRWFSLHAAVSIEGADRAGLRQFIDYGARSSVNLSLMSYAQPDDPAGIIPPAWFNLTRFHGAFATNDE